VSVPGVPCFATPFALDVPLACVVSVTGLDAIKRILGDGTPRPPRSPLTSHSTPLAVRQHSSVIPSNQLLHPQSWQKFWGAILAESRFRAANRSIAMCSSTGLVFQTGPSSTSLKPRRG
jgi:hypothetical protein